MNLDNNEKIIVSSCLAGIKCRYDGTCKTNNYIVYLVKEGIAVSMCPEVLGGLSIPREPSEIVGNKVLTKSGKDVTSNYKKGASIVLDYCKKNNIKKAILMDKSPSCGLTCYDGTFSGKLTNSPGITAELLLENGIEVISSKELGDK